ncbi:MULTISPECIES: RagB/SusD family nutrient uptake outer membrane protein [unclassified Leeuwenhoekiella]|uniref:RagB/SusD family nutrient uptake outer membrane protein n=1 Tax=unclassified Leeuwenhoekiella TaxID=2615029 RepID=UPI000C3F099B|nr:MULTISPECIES: RagB/SusD family nutrient uptake outer membrane protein [unclassified Leeuwenhoekiella]MAW96457.1 RagB/SusD family nutrient uptake outer membrane protein [Leeuwenhoekiella sp.]MBA81344.1 RagB/SusD family nutrient uptake outer membrane protein [Leeuwenhoekiella sp.]|tara:strand:+ start:931 stop:2637 length:1707 start_codon:yes stop_codon:yes gene_type:complete
MKKYIMMLALGSLSLVHLSCDQDLLDVESTSLTDQAVWADPVLAEAFVRGLYTGVRLADKEPGHNGGDTPAGFGRGFHWAMWASVSDEAIYSNDDATYLVQRGQMSPSNYGFMSTTWGRSFRNIREINLALSNIDTEASPFDQETKDLLVGELHFIRAFRYFELLRGFGEVPLMGDEVYDLTSNFDALYDRKSKEEVVAYIESEIDQAINLLPASNGARATDAAAMALKSRLLLYAASPLFTDGADDTAKWTKAAQAAKDVMDLNRFSLVTNLDSDPSENFRKLFVTRNMTSEDIFMRFYMPASNSGGRAIPIERMNGPNGSGGWGGNCPMQNLVDDFEMIDGSDIEDAGSGYDPQNPYVNRDPRFYATVVYNGSMLRDRAYESFVPNGKDSPDGNEPWNTSPTGYLMRKFIQEDITLNDWNNMGASPWRYFRYAEILLNYAEAQNEASGPDQSVYDAVNAVRQRAGMPVLSGLTKDQMREALQQERRVELAYEEHRYFDVRRWMIAMDVENEPAKSIEITRAGNGSLTYEEGIALEGKKFEEKHYWFPIPLSDITASGGKLEQNPGY